MVMCLGHCPEHTYTHTDTHNRFMALLDFVSDYPGEPVQKGETNLDLLEQEILSGIGICWAARFTPDR